MQSGPFAVLWSGGKDSCLALSAAREAGYRIDGLVNFFDQHSSRVRFHAVRASLVREQAHQLNLVLFQVPTSATSFQEAFSMALADLKRRGYVGLVAGDIHLNDVRAWNQQRADDAGLALIEPLWHQPGVSLLEKFVSRGFRAVLTCCDDRWPGVLWPGREIDPAFIRDAVSTHGLDPGGENGEYHSFVHGGPGFSAAVAFEIGEVRQSGGFSQIDLKTSELVG